MKGFKQTVQSLSAGDFAALKSTAGLDAGEMYFVDGVAYQAMSSSSAKLVQAQASSRYAFFLPAQQPASFAAGAAKDYSGSGADASLQNGYAAASAWSNRGYLTTGSGTDLCMKVAAAKVAFDHAKDSIIFSARVNMAQPGSNAAIFGSGYNNSGDLTSGHGFYISARTNGKFKVFTPSTAAFNASPQDSTATVFDGTDHILQFAIDAVSKTMFMGADGYLSDTVLNAIAGATNVTNAFGIGCSAPGVSGAASAAMKASGIHLFVLKNSGLPGNLDRLMLRLAAQPHEPVPAGFMEF